MSKSKEATRLTTSLTHDWERRNLPRLAEALPAWVMPDHLTAVGVLAAVGVGAGFVLAHFSPAWLLLSIGSLFLQWLGDSLDGTLARVRKRERPKYGYYVDRTADALAILFIAIGFGLSPFVSLVTGLFIAVAYLLIMVHAEICAYSACKFPLSIARIGPTEARVVLAVFTASLMVWTPGPVVIAGVAMSILDVVGGVIVAMLFAGFVISSIVQGSQLSDLDRPESPRNHSFPVQ